MASGDPISEPRHTSTERDTGRIEAFSDGVFAIAITLLILEVKVPHAPGGESIHLLAALLDLWPSYLALVLSSVFERYCSPSGHRGIESVRKAA